MQHYNTFSELIKDYKNLAHGRIYFEAAQNSFQNSAFWALSSKEAKDQEFIDTPYGSIPESLLEYQAKSLIDVATFQDIIDHKIEISTARLDQSQAFADAVAYYLENDDFEE